MRIFNLAVGLDGVATALDLWPTCASSPLANDLKAFVGCKNAGPRGAGKAIFRK